MNEQDILQIVASSIALNNTFLVYGSILIAILAIVVTILLFVVQIYLNKNPEYQYTTYCFISVYQWKAEKQIVQNQLELGD